MGQKPLKEQIREHKRTVEKSIRSLDRERAKLQREEQKLFGDIRKNAQNSGSRSALAIMAKDLVRIRKHQEKFMNLTA